MLLSGFGAGSAFFFYWTCCQGIYAKIRRHYRLGFVAAIGLFFEMLLCCLPSWFYFFFFCQKEKVAKRKGHFWPKAPPAKKGLYAGIAPLCSAGWRWYFRLSPTTIELGLACQQVASILLSVVVSTTKIRRHYGLGFVA
ncbi:MAG: hypothetical protein V4649_12250, partial [Bacteroidota bacterium]